MVLASTDCKIPRFAAGGGRAIVLTLFAVASLALAAAINAVLHVVLGWSFNYISVGFFFSVFFVASSLFVFRKDLGDKPERFFLCVLLTVSVFSSIAFATYRVSWDVESHYLFSLQFSDPDRYAELSLADAGMVDSTLEYFSISSDGLSAQSEQYDALDETDSGRTASASLTELYKRIASLPSSFVLWICDLLSAPFSLSYVLGRLPYALIYSFVTYFGMKKLLSGKMIYAVIALLPTAVFLASNYSYDYWVNAFSLYAVASVVSELQRPDKAMTMRSALSILLAFLVALGPKAIYFPLVLICFLLPKSKFDTDRLRLMFRWGAVFVCLIAIVSFVLPFVISASGPTGGGDLRGGSDVNSAGQVSFILSNPIAYARLLFEFLLGTYLAVWNSADFITFYAYLDHSSRLIWFALLALLIFVVITDKRDCDALVNCAKSRVFVGAIFVVSLILVATSLYVSFTPVGHPTVNGCQPRYIIPLLFPLLVFIGSKKLGFDFSGRREAVYNMSVMSIMAVALVVGLWQVYICHFV